MNKIEEAVARLKEGQLIIVADDETRESEGDLVGVAEYVTPESVNFMTKFGRGLICAPISEKIAQELNLYEMTNNNTDVFGTSFTISVDHIKTSTGISSFDRSKTIKALANPKSTKSDFNRPGHMFPLIAKPGGVMERRGHTEAAIDLAKLSGSFEAAYICEILKEDGTMARLSDLKVLSEEWEVPLITIEELDFYLRNQSPLKVSLPSKYGNFELTLFEDKTKKEHLVLSKGMTMNTKVPVLIRLHSECLTGDIFGSHRCDCGEQLHLAMAQIETEGRGAILYLRQEGRGIGLKNKLRAYQLQENGRDTYEANIELGFAPDERDYTFAVEILHSLGINEVKLLTNNPDKVHAIEALGIKVVERVPLETEPLKENSKYLKSKKDKFHHYLSI